jgi:hypothetical protein
MHEDSSIKFTKVYIGFFMRTVQIFRFLLKSDKQAVTLRECIHAFLRECTVIRSMPHFTGIIKGSRYCD